MAVATGRAGTGSSFLDRADISPALASNARFSSALRLASLRLAPTLANTLSATSCIDILEKSTEFGGKGAVFGAIFGKVVVNTFITFGA